MAARPLSAASRSSVRRAVALLLSAAATALAGCGVGFGSGAESGRADLLVSRDFGAERLVEARELELHESDTVMRILDRRAEVETRYGGGFVHSINGLTGGEGSRPVDWFYFVNGVEADRGSTDYRPRDGDRIWWDFRDWGASMRVPAVVGQYPEPFLNGYGNGSAPQTAVECHDAGPACDEVNRRLADAGADLISSDGSTSDDPTRVIVGTWQNISEEWAARAVSKGPEFSGVYMRVEANGGQNPVTFVALDAVAEEKGRYKAGHGLIAATRQGERRPVWLVTGTDQKGLDAAVSALGTDELEGAFALLVGPDGSHPLPVP